MNSMICMWYHERTIPQKEIKVHFVHPDNMVYTLCGEPVEGPHRYLWLGAELLTKENPCRACQASEEYGLWLLEQLDG